MGVVSAYNQYLGRSIMATQYKDFHSMFYAVGRYWIVRLKIGELVAPECRFYSSTDRRDWGAWTKLPMYKTTGGEIVGGSAGGDRSMAVAYDPVNNLFHVYFYSSYNEESYTRWRPNADGTMTWVSTGDPRLRYLNGSTINAVDYPCMSVDADGYPFISGMVGSNIGVVKCSNTTGSGSWSSTTSYRVSFGPGSVVYAAFCLGPGSLGVLYGSTSGNVLYFRRATLNTASSTHYYTWGAAVVLGTGLSPPITGLSVATDRTGNAVLVVHRGTGWSNYRVDMRLYNREVIGGTLDGWGEEIVVKPLTACNCGHWSNNVHVSVDAHGGIHIIYKESVGTSNYWTRVKHQTWFQARVGQVPYQMADDLFFTTSDTDNCSGIEWMNDDPFLVSDYESGSYNHYYLETEADHPSDPGPAPIAMFRVAPPTGIALGGIFRALGCGVSHLPIAAYEWSENGVVLSNGHLFVCNPTEPGTHIYAFRVQDNLGRWSEYITATVEVTGTGMSFLCPPNGTAFEVGDTFTITAVPSFPAQVKKYNWRLYFPLITKQFMGLTTPVLSYVLEPDCVGDYMYADLWYEDILGGMNYAYVMPDNLYFWSVQALPSNPQVSVVNSGGLVFAEEDHTFELNYTYAGSKTYDEYEWFYWYGTGEWDGHSLFYGGKTLTKQFHLTVPRGTTKLVVQARGKFDGAWLAFGTHTFDVLTHGVAHIAVYPNDVCYTDQLLHFVGSVSAQYEQAVMFQWISDIDGPLGSTIGIYKMLSEGHHHIQFRAYCQLTGWTEWVSCGVAVEIRGKSRLYNPSLMQFPSSVRLGSFRSHRNRRR